MAIRTGNKHYCQGEEGIVMGVEMHSTKRESHCFREKGENRKVDFDGNNTFGFVAFIG